MKPKKKEWKKFCYLNPKCDGHENVFEQYKNEIMFLKIICYLGTTEAFHNVTTKMIDIFSPLNIRIILNSVFR